MEVYICYAMNLQKRHIPAYFFNAVAIVFLLVFLSSCGSSRRAGSVKAKDETSTESRENTSKQKQLIAKYENQLGIKLDAEKSYPLYAFIDQWAGTPHCDGGNTKRCTDCSGFVCNLYREVYKTELPRSSEDQFKKAEKVKQKHLQEGELVFFKTFKGSKISHVGIYLANNKFVHVSTKKGVRIDDLTDDYYVKTFKAGGKIVK